LKKKPVYYTPSKKIRGDDHVIPALQRQKRGDIAISNRLQDSKAPDSPKRKGHLFLGSDTHQTAEQVANVGKYMEGMLTLSGTNK
jgi:hypothetical protein